VAASPALSHGDARLDRLGAQESPKPWSSRAAALGNFATAVASDHGEERHGVAGKPLEVTKRMGADGVLNHSDYSAPPGQEHTDGRGADVVIQVANNMAVPKD
jgi:hypothetical protein